MDTVDIVGALCWCLITVTFVVARSRVRLWNAACAVFVTTTLIVCIADTRGLQNADALALVVGLLLFWVGLLIVRAMLNRSISLHMLICYIQSEDDSAVEARITNRLDEAVRYRLVRSESEIYALSRTGFALDRLMGMLYRSFGIN